MLDAYVKRARENYDRLTARPDNLAHADQGAAMWRRAFEEHGLPLDPITARIIIFALGLTGGRAANFLPEHGDVVDWACAEMSTYLVPALGGEMFDLDDLPEIEDDDEGRRVLFEIELDPGRIGRWAKRGGFTVWAATGAYLALQALRDRA